MFLESEAAASQLANMRSLLGGEEGGRLRKWSPEALGGDWEPRKRLIEIKGLPFHLWTMGFFRAIGDLCGGFMKP